MAKRPATIERSSLSGCKRTARLTMACLLALQVLFSAGLAPVAFAEPIKGGIVKTEEAEQYPTVNPNDLVQVERGDTLDMKVSTTVSAGLNTEGDEFFGKLTKDYTVGDKVVLPRGTIVHGMVEGMTNPKRMGRNGHIQLKFDYLITPDGREIPIAGNHTTQDNKALAGLKIAGRSAGYTLAGGAIGALMVVRFGGLAAVAASNGYALAGGAAVGGAVGLAAAMLTKGKSAAIPEGAEVKIKLAEGMTLPTVNMPEQKADEVALDGLKVQVLGARVDKDPFGETRELTLTVDLTNQTKHTFSTFDVALVDEYNTVFYASPFGDTALWFTRLQPNSRMKGNLSFMVDDPTLQHYLVFYKQYSRDVLAKVPVDGNLQKASLAAEGKGRRGRNRS